MYTFTKSSSITPKRANEGKPPSTSTLNQTSRARKKKGSGTSSNMYGIMFTSSVEQERYAILTKWRITPTRYLDENTLITLGLKNEVGRLFNNIGLGYFILIKCTTFSRVTLEANMRSILDKIHGTIAFRLFWCNFQNAY